MPTPLTNRSGATPKRQKNEVELDAELASLIRRLAAKRPDIITVWPPAAVPPFPSTPAPRPTPHPARETGPTPGPYGRVRPLPWPRPRDPFALDPVTGRLPTREDFPVDRAIVDSIARLRAIAAGTHRPGAHWPAHATDAYYARKTRPSRLRRAVHTLTRVLRTTRTAAQPALALYALASVTLLTGGLLTTFLLAHLPLSH